MNQKIRYKRPIMRKDFTQKISYKHIKTDKSPCNKYIDIVLGTHVSKTSSEYLAFNHFVLNTPYYKEIYYINNHSH